MTQRKGLQYRPELDSLRGLAIIGVMLFHAALALPFRLWGGEYGVDLFFVLSGWLISTLLLQEHARTGTIDIRQFYFRRVLRLMPALIAALIGSGIVAMIVHPRDQVLSYPAAALAALFAVGNWFQASSHELGILRHTWTLAIEWQFYLIWPLALWTALRRGTSLGRLAVYLAGGAVVGAIVRGIVFHRVSGKAAQFWTISRADGFLLGAALALAMADGARVVQLLRRTDVALVAAVGIGFGVANLQAGDPRTYNGGLFVMICCFAVLVGHLALRNDGVFARVLRVPPLPQLGLISYGVYLYHVAVFRLVLHATGRSRVTAWAIVAMVCAVAVAVVSYIAVERPALQLKDRLRARVMTRSSVSNPAAP